MLFSFLGKAEGGKELCSGGGNFAQGGEIPGCPPPPLYASLFIRFCLLKVITVRENAD